MRAARSPDCKAGPCRCQGQSARHSGHRVSCCTAQRCAARFMHLPGWLKQSSRAAKPCGHSICQWRDARTVCVRLPRQRNPFGPPHLRAAHPYRATLRGNGEKYNADFAHVKESDKKPSHAPLATPGCACPRKPCYAGPFKHRKICHARHAGPKRAQDPPPHPR